MWLIAFFVWILWILYSKAFNIPEGGAADWGFMLFYCLGLVSSILMNMEKKG